MRFRAGKRLWEPDDDAALRVLYPDAPSDLLAKYFDRPLTAIYARAKKLGVEKSALFLAGPAACRLRRGDHVGARTQFKKGQAPPNKGLRRPGYGPGRMKETQFKKGEATNWQPVGSVRDVEGYLYRKVSDVRNVCWLLNWKPVHRLVWIEAHGPIPENHVVVFRNGDKHDVRLENLELVTRKELLQRNRLPPELQKIAQLVGQITRQVNKRKRGHGQEQDRRPAKPPVRHARGAAGSRQADGD